MCFTVFDETLEILFKDISFDNFRPGSSSLVKLAGLFLVSNFETMNSLMEKHYNRKDISFSYSMVEKINKFLAKIYK